MNYEMVILRLLHIVFGVFWAGSAIFFAFILQPRLRALGPDIQTRVMGALIPVMGPALITSAVVTIAAGTTSSPQTQVGALGYVPGHWLGLGHSNRVRDVHRGDHFRHYDSSAG